MGMFDYPGHSWVVVETSNSTRLVVLAISAATVGLVTDAVPAQDIPGTVSTRLTTNTSPSSRIDANSIVYPPDGFAPALATRSVNLSKSIGGSGIGGYGVVGSATSESGLKNGSQ
jgi:hypothetical protein